MADSRGSWADILDPSFRKIYGDEVKQIPVVAPSIFNVMTSAKQDEKDSSASGLSKLVQTSEGTTITYEDQLQGYDVTYTHLKYALGTQVTYEMFQDDQFNVMNRKPRELAKAKMRTKEQAAADVFNNAFTAGGGGLASFTSGDGVALVSTAHTRTDGGANISNHTTSDLAEDSLEVGLVAMRGTVDNKGQLQMVQPDTLLVPPALEKEARILLDSSGRVGTGNNDINPYQGRLKILVWDYLGSAAGGSDTAWFVLDQSLHALNWFDRDDRGIEGPETDFDNKTAKWSVTCRWSVGYSDWRGVYGSLGDNS